MMHKAAEFLRGCGAFCLATAEDDQPRVRPFGALDEFYDPAYFAQHRTGLLQTAAGKNYQILFFACCKAPANESLIFDPPESNNADLLAYLEANAAIYEPQASGEAGPILALSTCQSAENIERLILFGLLEELQE